MNMVKLRGELLAAFVDDTISVTRKIRRFDVSRGLTVKVTWYLTVKLFMRRREHEIFLFYYFGREGKKLE